MYIYEIGALTHYKKTNQMEKATEWRDTLDKWAKNNNIKTFNPAITFLKEIDHDYDPEMCVAQNDFYINKCDIAVVNIEDIDYSPGSIYELVRFKELRKPVIAFGCKGISGHWSPHIQSCVSQWCCTIDEVIELLCNMFSQNDFR
jgi:nucleoside 2-deoxyribosyltransferase